MRSLNNIVLICFAVISFHLKSQQAQETGTRGKRSLVMFNCGYRLPLETGRVINSGKGLYFELGLNLFKSGKSSLGIYGGWGWRDHLWSTAFHKTFRKDYAHAINSEKELSPLDSSVVSTSSHVFNTKSGRSSIVPGCDTYSFHDYSLYYGLILKLPAQREFFLKLYRGSTRSHYQGSDKLISGNSDYEIFQLRRNTTGCELMMKSFFNTKSLLLKRLGVSIYYEYSNFTTAKLYFDNGKETTSVSLSRFTSGSFLRKYQHQSAFGIKFSYSVF